MYPQAFSRHAMYITSHCKFRLAVIQAEFIGRDSLRKRCFSAVSLMNSYRSLRPASVPSPVFGPPFIIGSPLRLQGCRPYSGVNSEHRFEQLNRPCKK